MWMRSRGFRIASGRRLAAVVCLSVSCAAAGFGQQAAGDGKDNAPAAQSSSGGMAHMAGHMYLTRLRPAEPGDAKKAEAVVEAAKTAMAPYQDYRKALADGYKIFLPNIPQPQYHFTNYENGREAATRFDPLKPTSLLYKKTADGGYKLVGVMYTDRVSANEGELNDRIPLSVARWHEHTNFCLAPAGHFAAYFGPNAKFGLMGSIHAREACEAEGGRFLPVVLGWMVHVYPYESDPAKVWSVDDDDHGHDNMDHSAMPGMKMN